MRSHEAVLLLNRPRPAAERFVSGLPGSVLDRVQVCFAPLVGIRPVDSPIDWQDARGIIFTSSNGVAAASAADTFRGFPCYCVGRATTAAAKAAGWAAQMAGQTADDLVATLQNEAKTGPLLHLHGRHTRGDIAARLTASGLKTRAQVLYDQDLLPFTDAAQRVLRADLPVITLLFSPRTARHFAQTVQYSAPLWLGALSDAVAKPLFSLEKAPIEVAKSPDAESMGEVLEILLNRASRVEAGQGEY